MNQITSTLWNAQYHAEAVGKVVMGLSVLCSQSKNLFMIVEGQAPDRIKSSDISFGMGGILIRGQLLTPYVNIKEYERYSGEPCVAFEMFGQDVIFAPADLPEDEDFVAVVDEFFKRDWFNDDHVYLSDLNGPVGDKNKKPVELMRRQSLLQTHPDLSQRIAEDRLVIYGEEMPLNEITWAQRDDDGDGNRYLHLVMNDGRYRRIAMGDLGR